MRVIDQDSGWCAEGAEAAGAAGAGMPTRAGRVDVAAVWRRLRGRVRRIAEAEAKAKADHGTEAGMQIAVAEIERESEAALGELMALEAWGVLARIAADLARREGRA